jgi:SHS2 domain-containing protein
MKPSGPSHRSLQSSRAPSAKKSQRRAGEAGAFRLSAVFGLADMTGGTRRSINVARPSEMPGSCKGRAHDPRVQCDDTQQVRSGGGFEFFDHPADVKLCVWGRDLESLFAAAAEGMMAFLFGDGIADLKPDRTETIEIEAKDREALLVDWLSELLYRATCEYRAYMGFRIHELTESRLKAAVASAAAEAVEDIKAVTHHELSVRKCARRWEASIVFDI